MAQLELFRPATVERQPTKRVLSYGGGLDSFALLLLAVELRIHLDAIVFVDVGDPDRRDPAEWPGTYRHILEVSAPLCARAGIEFVWILAPCCSPLAPRRRRFAPVRHVLARIERIPVRDGERSLFHWLRRRRQIPVAGPTRICTTVAKVERFERWLASRSRHEVVEVWIGFEAGEEARAAKDPNAGTGPRKGSLRDVVRLNRFPLIEWGLCRCRCEALVRRAGYPVPRKSACVFCPYGTRGDWQTLAHELPRQFCHVVHLESAKPPTRTGKTLTIMGYRTLYDATGNAVGYTSTPLPNFIRGDYHPKAVPCAVCGAPLRASKATGCGYLEPTSAPALTSFAPASPSPAARPLPSFLKELT